MKNIKVSYSFLITLIFVFTLGNACVKGTDPAEEEMKRIAEFLELNGISEDPKPSGLYYLEITEGDSLTPVAGDTVGINFIQSNIMGYVSNTNIEEKAKEYNLWDPSFTYEPLRFKLGDSTMIAGINEGVSYMKFGGDANLIIPSSLAFENYETLLIYLELVEVKKSE